MTIYANIEDVKQGMLESLPELGPRSAAKPRIAQIHTSKNNGRFEVTKVPFESDLSATTRQAIDKVRVLQKYTAETGFKTTRSQNDILQTLDGEDLANALLVLKYDK